MAAAIHQVMGEDATARYCRHRAWLGWSDRLGSVVFSTRRANLPRLERRAAARTTSSRRLACRWASATTPTWPRLASTVFGAGRGRQRHGLYDHQHRASAAASSPAANCSAAQADMQARSATTRSTSTARAAIAATSVASKRWPQVLLSPAPHAPPSPLERAPSSCAWPAAMQTPSRLRPIAKAAAEQDALALRGDRAGRRIHRRRRHQSHSFVSTREMIVLGGGVSNIGEPLFGAIRRTVRERSSCRQAQGCTHSSARRSATMWGCWERPALVFG